jgi:FtsH-binding integral membrane protein
MKKMKSKYSIPLVVVFVLVTVISFLGATFLKDKGFNTNVILIGNLVLFATTLLSMFLLINGMLAKTTPNFLRSIYLSFMAKLFTCALGAFIYIKTANPVNKPAIFVLLALYLVYAFLEIKGINRLTQDLKNGKTTSTH